LTEYEADYPTQPDTAAVASFPNHHTFQRRQQHPAKSAVLGMLVQGQSVNAIERETGVTAKTIRKWRDEIQSPETELRAA
jgi:DNA-binding NarL/FixJ family response regulator